MRVSGRKFPFSRMRLPHFLFLVSILFVAPASVAPAKTEVVRAYKGAIVMDAASGRVLFDDRADEVGPPASVTPARETAVRVRNNALGSSTEHLHEMSRRGISPRL